MRSNLFFFIEFIPTDDRNERERRRRRRKRRERKRERIEKRIMAIVCT